MKVSLFCSVGPRKNIANQILACSRLPEAELHLNGLSQNPEFARLLRDLGVKYVDHGWMDRETYIKTVADMDIGLQVTFAETFNYVVVDHLLQGVPVVVSHMVPAVAWDPELAELVVDRADSPDDIAGRMKETHANRAALSIKCKESVRRLARRNNLFLQELLRV